ILTTANGVNHTANCNTCHDPHSLTGNLTDEGEDVQLRHMTFNLDTTAVGPGTDPQSFQTVDHLCGQCHNGRGVDPSDAALTANTSRFSGHHSDQYNMLLGIGGVVGDGPVQTQTSHANIPGQCSHCHMPDHRHTFTVSYNACIPCHTETDAANRVTSIKTLVLNDLYALRVRMSNWAIAAYPNVDGNEFFWDYRSAISSEGFTPPDQSTVPIEIKRARHNYYFIVESKDFGVHNAIYVKLLLKVANDNLDALGVPAAPLTATSVSTAQKMNTVQSDANRSAKGGEGTD
ncbi:MAG TPA: hypothetical protein VNI20_00655, partial [Fimbriimonadaceae bacterium]|nr:hypothetical protein [Fimbriimonadaceae bacterium]